jgi:hypothetical protein
MYIYENAARKCKFRFMTGAVDTLSRLLHACHLRELERMKLPWLPSD